MAFIYVSLGVTKMKKKFPFLKIILFFLTRRGFEFGQNWCVMPLQVLIFQKKEIKLNKILLTFGEKNRFISY